MRRVLGLGSTSVTTEQGTRRLAYQAGYALRLFELRAEERIDLRGTGQAERQVDALLRTGQPLDATDQEALPRYTQIVAHWALIAYSGSKATGFPIQTRHHFRFDTATGSDRSPPPRWPVEGWLLTSAAEEPKNPAR